MSWRWFALAWLPSVARARLGGVLLAAMVFAGIAGPASAERRAIVIGNSEYAFAPLVNPANDARLIATTLTELDFDVLLFYDIHKAAIGDLEKAVREHLLGAEMAILYYAGHAVQHSGRNLLLPVDVRTGSAQQVIEDAIALDALIDIVNDDPTGIKLIILDACRNSPVAEEEGLEAGLAQTESGSGQVLIAFSTAAGEVAYDGAGVNSPYSAALANALRQPDRDVYDVFRAVRGEVRQATEGFQIPWITGSIESRFVFRPGGEEAVPAEAVAEGDLSIDEVLWYFIRESRDPSDFARFAETFPQSRHHAEAAERSETVVAAVAERGLYVSGELASSAITVEPLLDDATLTAGEEFVFQQAGERAVSETFRLWPKELPDTERGMKSLVTECDLLAADPNDPQRSVPGVTNGMVNIRGALRACAFALAADRSNPRLQFQLGRVLELADRYDWAEHFYGRAGEQQYSAALVNLGYMWRVGMGREPDHALALDYYLRASQLGNLRARTNVGTAFIRGQGVPENPREGILWYRLAASSGWTNAITALGDSYHRGVGVEQDDVKAARLYTAAADAGQIDAMTNLGRAYLAGAGVEKSVERGLELLLQATEMGNEFAPLFAARLYLGGADGVEADPGRALDLLELSARRGFEDAYLDLAKGYRDGRLSGGAPDFERAYFNALLAVRFEVKGAEEERGAIGDRLDASAREAVEAEAELFVEQNGE